TYYYTVGSIDRANNGAVSALGQFTTLTSGDATPPAAPSGLTSTLGSGQVLLSWSANTEVDLAGYNVYRKVSGADSFAALATRVSGLTYTDQGLTNGTTYDYRMAAVDRADNVSSFTSTLSLTPGASSAPSAPASLSRTGDNHLRPTLVFANATPASTGATLSYTVQVSTQSTFGNVTASQSGIAQGSGGAGTGQTAWTVTRDLTEGGTYYWRVRAVEGTLTGPFSETQQFVAQAAPELPGDFDGNNVVDFDDFFAFVDVFGQPAADHPLFDLDGAGDAIDFDDFFAFVDVFGTSAPGKPWALARQLDETAFLALQAAGGDRADDGRITVRVWADGITDMGAFGLVVGYDPAAVTFESAQEGPGHLLGSQGGSAPLFAVLHHRPGELLIGNGLVEGDPVSGHGLLAELTFRRAGGAGLNRAFFELRDAFVTGGTGEVRRVARLQAAQLRPQVYSLGANYPNPFNPSTVIEYALPEATPVTLAVYDVLGRRVRSLVATDLHAAGFYSVAWDGTDQEGRPVGNGLYFYRLTTPAFQRTGKMTMVK
ncbi:MAG: FlgD immunoglobulin-like domain containing protein, partial [Gemmatimonadota bacterium]